MSLERWGCQAGCGAEQRAEKHWFYGFGQVGCKISLTAFSPFQNRSCLKSVAFCSTCVCACLNLSYRNLNLYGLGLQACLVEIHDCFAIFFPSVLHWEVRGHHVWRDLGSQEKCSPASDKNEIGGQSLARSGELSMCCWVNSAVHLQRPRKTKSLSAAQQLLLRKVCHLSRNMHNTPGEVSLSEMEGLKSH